MASTLATGMRDRLTSSSVCSSCIRICSMRIRKVVLPTPVGPNTITIEFGSDSRMAAINESFAATRCGWAMVNA